VYLVKEVLILFPKSLIKSINCAISDEIIISK
jgi:hypothetical protein